MIGRIPDYSLWRIDILYEDPFILGINKPPGTLVHPVGRHVYDTLMNYLHYRYRDAMEQCPDFHLRLCHRIDKDTTGVLLVGKDNYVHRSVQRQLEERTMSKEYYALVIGHVSGDLREIDRPIAEGRDLNTALNGENLKRSRTLIRVVRRFRDHTLVSASPVTGRQNQIRVHLASVGHSLVGDERYDGPPAPDIRGRLFLRSRSISGVSLPADLAHSEPARSTRCSLPVRSMPKPSTPFSLE